MSTRWSCTGLVILLAVAIHGQGWTSSGRTAAAERADLVIRGGHLLDMVSDQPGARAIKGIVVRNGKIDRIVAADSKEALPDAARVIEAESLYVMPGLVDAHIHFRPWFPEPFLHYGVTTLMDTAPCPDCSLDPANEDPNQWILKYIKASRGPAATGPVLYATGMKLEGPEGHAERNIYILKSATEIPDKVAYLASLGFSGIKVEESLPPDFRKRVVQEAEKRKLPVVGHSREARESIAAGMKFIEHMYPIVRSLAGDAAAETDEYRMDMTKAPELIDLMVRQRVVLNPTMLGRYGFMSAKARAWAEEDKKLLSEPLFKAVPANMRPQIPAFYLRTDKMNPEQRKQAEEGYQKVQAFVREFSARGGRLLTGTDSTGNKLPGISMHRELQLEVDAGVPPYKALVGATRLAAEMMRKSDSIGTLQAGRQADILILGSNPAENISATLDIRYVIRQGAVKRTPRELLSHVR